MEKQNDRNGGMCAMDKYVAYVSTYTMGDDHGIKIYDVDMENGTG